LDAAAAVVQARGVSAVLLCTEDFEVMSAVSSAFETEPRWRNVRLLTDKREARNSEKSLSQLFHIADTPGR